MQLRTAVHRREKKEDHEPYLCISAIKLKDHAERVVKANYSTMHIASTMTMYAYIHHTDLMVFSGYAHVW